MVWDGERDVAHPRNDWVAQKGDGVQGSLRWDFAA